MKKIYLSIFIFLVNLTFSINSARAEDYFWVNGEGHWWDVSLHWSKSTGNSGGIMHTVPPTALDNVYFDANSFLALTVNPRVMMEGSPSICNNMDWTGAAHMPKIVGSQPLYIFGSLKFITDMVVDYGAPTYFKASNKTVSVITAGNSLPVAVYFDGQAGHWELLDALDVSGNICINWGHVKTNNNAVSCFRFSANPLDQSNVRSLDMGSSIITIELGDDNLNAIFSCNVNNDLGTFTVSSSGSSKIIFLGSLGNLSTMHAGKNLTYDNVEFYGDGHLLSNLVTFKDVIFKANGTLHVETSVFDTVEIYKKGLAYSNFCTYNRFFFSTHPTNCGCSDCRNTDYGLLEGNNNQITKIIDFHRNGTISGNNNYADSCRFYANGNFLTGANEFEKVFMQRQWGVGCTCPSWVKNILTLEKNKVQKINDSIILFGPYYCQHTRITTTDSAIQASIYSTNPLFIDYIEILGINGQNGASLLNTAKRSVDLGNNSNWDFQNTFIPLQDSLIVIDTVSPCSNSTNGKVTIWARGGEKPYKYYRWVGGGCSGFSPNFPDSSNVFSNLAKGTYHFKVKDKYLCESLDTTVTVGGPDPIVIDSVRLTPVSCYGKTPPDGKIIVYAKGGTSPLKYKLDGGGWDPGNIITGVSVGAHSIYVSDVYDCPRDTVHVTMTEQPALMLSIATPPNTIKCSCDSTGQLIVRIMGGTPPYAVFINQITSACLQIQNPIRDTIPAPYWTPGKTYMVRGGDYNITITDGKGCVIEELSRHVSQPFPLNYTYTKTTVPGPPTTYTLTVFPSGGVPPYTHHWNTGATTATISGLLPGFYCDTIRDFNSCLDTACILIEPLSVSITSDTVCYDACTGFVCANPSGGSAPYSYNWSTGSGAPCLNNICHGTYWVTVTDASGGSATNSVVVHENSQITASFLIDTVSCYGLCNGGATISASGGTAPYTYYWINTTNHTNAINGLCAGSYTVSVTDFLSCSTTFTAVIPQYSQLGIDFTTGSLNCMTPCTYWAKAQITGGYPPYTYSWMGGGPGANTDSIYSRCIGTYTLTVTDAKNCTFTKSVLITALTVTVDFVTINCFGNCTGSANASATGGNSPYSFVWKNSSGATIPGNPIVNLCSGDYTVYVTDALNCTIQQTISITQPSAPLTISALTYTTMLNCYGDENGTAAAAGSGGTQPYTFNWERTNPPPVVTKSGATVAGLSAGTWLLTLTDGKNCIATSTFTINQPNQVVISQYTKTDINCATDGNAGSIVINAVTGGTPPYIYTIDCPNGTFTFNNSFTGLAPGTYNVGAKDSHGCPSACTPVIITRPPVIVNFFAPVQSPTGFGVCNGSITANISGGIPPYIHKWYKSPGIPILPWQTGAISVISNLCVGTYIDSVFDANGCRRVDSINISQPQALLIGVDSSNVTCFGKNNGWITITVSGGVQPYQIICSNGASASGVTTLSINNLSPNYYTFSVTDANGNFALKTVHIIEPNPILVNFQTNTVCFGAANGIITAIPSQGTPPFTHHWSNGMTTGVITGLVPNQWYTDTIHDANNCMAYDSAFLPVNPQMFVHVNNLDSNICSGDSIQMDVNAYGGGYPYAFAWTPHEGIADTTVLQPMITPLTSEYYKIKFTDSNGCMAFDSIFVSIDSLPAASFNQIIQCNSSSVQFVDQSQSGASWLSITDWLWDFGDGNLSVQQNPIHTYAGLGPYNVSLTVTNTNGCTDYFMTEINLNNVVMVNFTADTVCFGSLTTLTAYSLNPNIAIDHWTWQIDNLPLITMTPPQSVLLHQFAFQGSHNVTLDLFDTTGCFASKQKEVVVRFRPQPDFTYTWGCTSDTVKFHDLTPAGTVRNNKWVWDFGDGTSATVFYPNSADVYHIYASSGTYSVTLTVTDSAGCQNSATKSFYYIPSPFAEFSYSHLCFGESTQFNDQSVAYTGSIVLWQWNFGEPSSGMFNISSFQNPTHVYSSPGTYFVKLKIFDNSLCTDSIIRQVVIHPAPAADFQATTNCAGNITVFNDLSISSGSPLSLWQWNFGDGNIETYTSYIAGIPHLYTLSGQYTVTLTVHDQNGCSFTKTRMINVLPLPTPLFQFTPGCADQLTYFTDFSNGSGSAVIQWNWNFGDPGSGGNNTSTLKNPTHTFETAGFYPVSLCVMNADSCINCYTQTIGINPSPVADFTADTVCRDAPTHFNNLSYCSGDVIISWEWNFGDGSPSSNVQWPVHTYLNSATYNVSLIVTSLNGCTSSIVKPVVVHENPHANFTYNQINGDSCFQPGQPTQFTDLTSITGGNLLTGWQWDFGDGTYGNVQNPVHQYSNSGTYYVTLVVFDDNGCQNTIIKQVILSDKPIASFSYTITVCDSVCFTDASVGSGVDIQSWLWDFGDPASGVQNFSTLKNPCHAYFTPFTQTYTVKLIVTNANGCSDTLDLPVTVSKPVPDFTTLNPPCLSEATEFSDLSVSIGNVISAWSWDFGDPSSLSNTSNLQNPIHIYNSVGTKYVTLTVTNGNGCTSMIGKPVEVSYPPAANWDFDKPSCFPDSTQFLDVSMAQGSIPIVSYHWDFGDGTAPSTLKDPMHLFAFEGTYPVTLTVENANGCTHYVTRPFYNYRGPAPEFTTDPVSKCRNAIVNFTDLSVPAFGNIVSWDWDFGDMTAHSTIQNPGHVYPGAGIYIVKLIVHDQRGCGDSVVHSITVNDLPPADFIADTTCLGSPTQFVNLTPGTSMSWLWDFGEPSSPAFNTSTDFQPQHSYLNTGNYFVRLTATDNNTCYKDTLKSVMVVPLPVVNFSNSNPCSGQPVQFTDQSIIYQGSISGWLWDFGDPLSGINNTSTLRHPAHIFTQPTAYNVTLIIATTGNCPAASFAKQVIIRPAPVASFTNSSPCFGEIIGFTDLTNQNGGTNLVSWNWDFGDPLSGISNTSSLQNPSHIFSGTGTFSIRLITANADGCSDTIIKPVTVFSKPGVDFTFGSSCASDTTCFQINTSITNINLITNYAWDLNGDGSIDSFLPNPCYIYPTPGIIMVVLTVTDTNGCQNTVTHAVNVKSLPIAAFNTMVPDCAGDSIRFIDYSTSSSGFITRWRWHFGDLTPDQIVNFPANPNVAHRYNGSGPFTVKLTVVSSLGCENVETQTLTLVPSPQPMFSHSEPCMSDTIQFTDLSSPNGGGIITSWAWNFGDSAALFNNTSTLQNPTHVFSALGSYQVSLTVTGSNGCTKDTMIMVTIKPLPGVDFAWQAPCVNQPVPFTVDPVFTNIPVLTGYLWNFGDGVISTELNPVHYFANTGNFTVTLTVTDTSGCSSHKTHVVVVEPRPQSFFSNPATTCSSDSVAFADLSTTTLGYIQKWEWDFGNSNSKVIYFPNNPDARMKYDLPGIYTVSLTVTNSHGCYHTYSHNITVIPTPVANFQYSDTCENAVVHFNDTSYPNGLGNVVSWAWNFGDPGSVNNNTSTLQNPAHVFTTGNSTYLVKLIIVNFNNCIDTIVKPVFIRPAPPVDFTFDPTCLNMLVNFSANPALMQPASIATWDWDFGDGSPHSTNPGSASHLYVAAGTYQAVLTVADTAGCTGSLSKTITVVPPPAADFAFSSPICDSGAVQFTDQSVIPAGFPGYITQWLWNWGDGTTTTVIHPASPNVSHVFPAGVFNFIVRLTVSSSFGCQDSITKLVGLVALPIAAFEIVPGTPACATQTVQFNDLSQTNGGGSIAAWLWNFGDPGSGVNNTSVSPDPAHTFSAAGSYTVSLTVTNANGCNHSVAIPIIIDALPVADFAATTACAGAATQFTDNSVSIATITSYHWIFGDGGTSAMQSPSHTYMLNGLFNVTLTITDSNGCIKSIVKPVAVNPKPVAEFSFPPVSCIGNPVTFTDLSFIPVGFSAFINNWVWKFGDGTAPVVINYPSNSSTTHTFAGTATSHAVWLIVTSSNGCVDSIQHVVISNPSPVVNFSFSLATCVLQPVQFTDLSQTNGGGSISSWSWNFGDPLSGAGNYSTQQNPSHSFTGTGTFIVTLTATSSGGCTNSYTPVQPIVINALPSANFTFSQACEGSSTTFTNASTTPGTTTILSYSWNFGDGGTSNLPSPQHIFAAYGNYNVTLTIVNSNGCIHASTKQVSVSPKPIADFSFSAASCVGNPVNFFNQSFVPPGFSSSINQWQWDFGDGTTIAPIMFPSNPNITHTFAGNANSHLVTLTATTTAGCVNMVSKTVTSVPSPVANFTHSSALCANQPVQFTDQSQTNGGGMITTWNWNFGDPLSGGDNISTLQNPPHSFSGTGPFNIKLIVTNASGCKDTLLPLPQLIVNARPLSNFSADTVCQGSITTFTDLSTPNSGIIVAHLWDFGDGVTSTSASPAHLYAVASTYSVKLTISNSMGCVKDTTKQVLVLGKPIALFSYTSPNCAGDSVQFNDLSSTPHGFIQQWTWDFGDGTVVGPILSPNNQNIKHKYANGGSYNVKLTIVTSDGCSVQKITLVQIGFRPLANFSFGNNACPAIPLQFTDLSQLNGGPAITNWSWNFGDPVSGVSNFSTVQNPSHTFSAGGTFIVRLMVTNANGCVDSVLNGKSVTVNAAPVASFSATTSCIASPTQFDDNSTTSSGTLTAWLWNFGDPASGAQNTSTLANPTHVYTIQGTYSVTLHVTNSNQCFADTLKQVIVNTKPTAGFIVDATCETDSVQFTDQSLPNGNTIWAWDWNFGDGSPHGTIQNPKHAYVAPGNYNVKLVVTNLFGCEDSITKPVTVHYKPLAAFSYSSKFCPAGKVFFTDESQALGGASISTSEWMFEPGGSVFGTAPDYTYNITNMSYPVSMIVTDTHGCKDTILDSLIFVKPGWGFTFTNNDTCQGYFTGFNPVNLAPGDSLHPVSWNFGDPVTFSNNTSSLYRPTHVFSGSGDFIVKMKARNTDGCIDSVYKEVHVDAAPDPYFNFVTTPCDSTVQFLDSTPNPGTSAIASWKWVWGDGSDTLTLLPPQNGDTSHLYVTPGIYQVTLIVTNEHGCSNTITRSVQRFPCIKAGFSYQDTLRCARYKISFADTSLPITRIKQWHWSWGDGKDTIYTRHAASITHVFADSGNYNVILEVQSLVNGTTITDNMSGLVKIHPTPVTRFSNVPVCLNQITLFRDTSKTYGSKITKWNWIYGPKPTDTSSMKNPVHLYDTAGIYQVKLVVMNGHGCKDSLTKPTLVYGLPVADYDFIGACTGDSTVFTDRSESDTTFHQWHWTFGDPTTSMDTSVLRNPKYKYPNTGDFSVTMIVRDNNSCADTIDSTLTIHQSPVAAFTMTENIDETPGKIRLNNESSIKSNYHWFFGNGKNTDLEENPVFQYAEDTTVYTISLVVADTNGCTDTTSLKYEFMYDNLYVPNAFSPTFLSSAKNWQDIREFKPKGLNLKDYHVMVFDKWGHLIWESNKLDCNYLPSSQCKGSPYEGWDGTYNGELMPQDIYMWKISATFKNGKAWEGSDMGKGSTTTMGTVTLIR